MQRKTANFAYTKEVSSKMRRETARCCQLDVESATDRVYILNRHCMLDISADYNIRRSNLEMNRYAAFKFQLKVGNL